jgi:hypothetical protein
MHIPSVFCLILSPWYYVMRITVDEFPAYGIIFVLLLLSRCYIKRSTILYSEDHDFSQNPKYEYQNQNFTRWG